jgi:hypothetical protein
MVHVYDCRRDHNTIGTLLHSIGSASPVANGRFGTSLAFREKRLIVGQSGLWTPKILRVAEVFEFESENEFKLSGFANCAGPYRFWRHVNYGRISDDLAGFLVQDPSQSRCVWLELT